MTNAAPDLTRFAHVPEVMIALPRWVLWKSEKVEGRLTKVPYQTTGVKADSTNASTWTTYADALDAFAAGGFDGVGFVLGDGFCGVDLDNCIVNGELLPYARKIIEDFSTYTEISPSGHGVKLFFVADPLPLSIAKGGTGYRVFNKTKERGKIEMYSEDRFFTVTGNAIEVRP